MATGVLVLVLQRNGIPYPSVDQIKLQGPNGTTTLNRVPLTTIIPPGSCAPTQFHYEAVIPVSTPIAQDTILDRARRIRGYTLQIKVKTKHQSFKLDLSNCDFQSIVTTM